MLHLLFSLLSFSLSFFFFFNLFLPPVLLLLILHKFVCHSIFNLSIGFRSQPPRPSPA